MNSRCMARAKNTTGWGGLLTSGIRALLLRIVDGLPNGPSPKLRSPFVRRVSLVRHDPLVILPPVIAVSTREANVRPI